MSILLTSDFSSSNPLILTTTLILLFALYRFFIYPALLSPLARIPNAHWSSPFSRLWALSIRFGHTENRTLQAAHRRLGPVVRVAPNELSIDDIGCVRIVYQGGFDKPVWYSVFDNYGVPCMFSTRQSQEHSARKRMISHVYSKSYIHTSPAGAAQSRVILFERLLPLLDASTSVDNIPHGLDVHSLFLATTMDFISAYVFGIGNSTNFIQNKAYRAHWLELYKSRNDYGIIDQELPRLTAVCRRLGIPLCPKWVDTANQELGRWCQHLCSKAMEGAGETAPEPTDPAFHPVVLHALLSGLAKEEAANSQKSPLFSTAIRHRDLSVASELFDHILAGQETAGVTLTYLTWRLSQSPDLQRKLRAELLNLTPNMKLTQNGLLAQLPDPKQLDGLPILHAVMMETLRLHAPLPGPQPRQSPYPSSQIGPYEVPGGVRVSALAYTLHRDQRVFPEPDQWIPERWLPPTPGRANTEDEEGRKERYRQFWAFGSGGRMCIGSNFAVHEFTPASPYRLEMKLIIAAIYSNFTSHIVDDDGVAEQGDGYSSRPAKESLYLRFERAR